ncbi:hypothetical protein BDV25DRAFT_170304 [Aspergillus avenaceus]|uniref:FAD-binding domain-containing protein n=1 Tax=Aspergillus avenaceus TaxID=36643 RepID=A0A5N6U8I3_ASPAV|nr:hypothetical protein BDV25DRAFT_170304 [Aspergillus avenaceus]
MPLKIQIIGSGLAGLAAARILREHHDVTVYERGGPDTSTGGQGICLFSNGVKILQTMGYDRVRAGGVPCHGYRGFDKQGNQLQDFPIDFKGRYGADTLCMKRSDFRDELLYLATRAEGGRPVEVVYDTNVVDVLLDGGVVVRGDVVVVADGVHSRLRHRVVGDGYRAQKNGMTCYRVAPSAEKAKETLGYLPEWWDPTTSAGRISALQSGDGSNRMIATYPIRNYEYINFSCLFPTKQDKDTVQESWYADGDGDEMVDMFADYYEPVLQLLRTATEVKVWELQDMDPLPHWNKGRVILIGDAAHAMTPMQGQGANMAVEDADALRLLRPGLPREEVEGVLEQVDAIRRPRATRVLEDTRQQAKDITMEERIANLDYNCGYNGVFEAVRG